MPLPSIFGNGRPLSVPPITQTGGCGFYNQPSTHVVRRVPARKPPPRPDFGGTKHAVPYQASSPDGDFNTKLHSISAMQVYAHKSVEELRMEDYHVKNEKGSICFCRPPVIPSKNEGHANQNTLQPTKAVDNEPMEWDLQTKMDDLDIAVSQAAAFLDHMAADLVKDEWKELASFVKPSWKTLGDQLTKLFLLRLEWKRLGLATDISVGYHYTTERTMEEIRVHGLLTRADRRARGVTDNFYAAAFGDGCYTGNDPLSFYGFRQEATVGLLVLRLLGCVGDQDELRKGSYPVDTVCFNRQAPHSSQLAGYVILRNSAQCAVLAEYNGRVVNTLAGCLDMVMRLQTYFEETVDRVLVEKETIETTENVKDSFLVNLLRTQQEFFLTNEPREFSFCYAAPQTLESMTDADGSFVQLEEDHSDKDCPICLDSLSGDIVRIKGCLHGFHADCADLVKQKSSTCPVCRTLFKPPRGISPSGKMIVAFDPKFTCFGPSARGYIKLVYIMPTGIQKSYHDNRGYLFNDQTSRRVAYVPDNVKGRKLLRRLVYAFLHGLTFRVGTSLTSGKSNVVTWASIHHKTNPTGSHGFPDPHFFANCNNEMDDLGVPESSSLQMPQLEELDRYIVRRDNFDNI